MSRPARSAGGMKILSGVKPHEHKPLSRAESKEFCAHMNGVLGITFSKKNHALRHFSHFDEAVASLGSLPTAEACQKAVALLGECVTRDWRGVRPQLASLLLVITQMARRDGYNLRVVAETALHSKIS